MERNYVNIYKQNTFNNITGTTDGNVGDIDCKLILYPALQFALDTSEFERFVKEVVEIVLAGKDSLGEDLDEQSDDAE